MKHPPPEMGQLRERVAEIRDLERVQAIAHWDMHTYMPDGGAEARREQLSTLSRLIHQKMTDPQLGTLLYRTGPAVAHLPEDAEEAALYRVLKREYERAIRIPTELMGEAALAASEGLRAWLRAREEEDFQLFLPALKKNHDVSRRTAEAIDPTAHPLDVLLDRREPGITRAEVERILAELKEVLVPLIARAAERDDRVDDAVLHRPYDPSRQWHLSLEAARAIGFDPDGRGRVDCSVHPFTTAFSPDDVRITTRIHKRAFAPCFFASLHEAGHGTYEQGLPAPWNRCVLGAAASSGMHESQSRLWENVVGRSREFWRFFYPRVREYFPGQTAGVSWEQFWRAVNRVHPSLIRVEADEATYNLHILIRFELERAVYDGDLRLRDLPAAWEEKYTQYLGVRPRRPTEGVLQDVHWSGGFGASFVSYTLGNVMSVQLFEAARREMPDLPDQFCAGDFSGLLRWMQTNVHARGRTLSPTQLLRRATGRKLNTRPYLEYIERKVSDVYDL